MGKGEREREREREREARGNQVPLKLVKCTDRGKKGFRETDKRERERERRREKERSDCSGN